MLVLMLVVFVFIRLLVSRILFPFLHLLEVLLGVFHEILVTTFAAEMNFLSVVNNPSALDDFVIPQQPTTHSTCPKKSGLEPTSW